jgi:hypothetical protein
MFCNFNNIVAEVEFCDDFIKHFEGPNFWTPEYSFYIIVFYFGRFWT